MNIFKQLFLAWRFNHRAKKLVIVLSEREKEGDVANWTTMHSFVKRDNKIMKNCIQILRDSVAYFYKEARKVIKFEVQDYSDLIEIYERNKALGVNHGHPAWYYVWQWVTVVNGEYAYKKKKGQNVYGGGGWNSFDYDGVEFEPYTFRVTQMYGHTLVDGSKQGMGVDKNQVRLATKEEIQAIIDKQFILGEN